MSDPATSLSKLVSHALRHEPWLYELELDADGWVDIDQLLDALRTRAITEGTVGRAELEDMVRTSDRQRHEISGERIRAGYGHSVPGRVAKVAARPPRRLYHGTAPASTPDIERHGLLPMRRQYVHLSSDVETALAVGRRKDPQPAIFEVLAIEAYIAGVAFYPASALVWLADAVPICFLQKHLQRRDAARNSIENR